MSVQLRAQFTCDGVWSQGCTFSADGFVEIGSLENHASLLSRNELPAGWTRSWMGHLCPSCTLRRQEIERTGRPTKEGTK